MNRITLIALGAALSVLGASCSAEPGQQKQPKQSPQQEPQPRQPPAESAPGTKSITLPVADVKLPPGPGREAVNAACVLCHTTQYIFMQPTFSRETWTAEVDKMRKTYGAPVTDQQAKDIVDYLVSVRGPKDQAGKTK
jgi:cytochrome c5